MSASKTRVCSVPGCFSRKGGVISFHAFPKEERMRSKWINILGIKKPNKHLFACSNHFKNTDCLLLNVQPRCLLKKDTLPSRNLGNNVDKTKNVHTISKRERLSLSLGNRSGERSSIRKTRKTEATPVNHSDHSENEITDQSGNEMDMTADESALSEQEQEEPLIIPERTSIQHSTKNIQVGAAFNSSFTGKESQINLSARNKAIQVNLPISLNASPMNKTIHTIGKLSISELLVTDSDVKIFTGISSKKVLGKICTIAEPFEAEHTELLLSLKERLILVFIKLKTNLSFKSLSVMFGIPDDACKMYFHYTLNLANRIMKLVIPWLSKELIAKGMPECFKKFNDTRIVLNYFEFTLETACGKENTQNIVKFLIGAAPSGLLTFVSNAFGGAVSKKDMFLKCAILDKLSSYEGSIIIDNGFPIENECSQYGIKVIKIPDRDQGDLLPDEAFLALDIIDARIKVDETFRTLKSFKCIEGEISQEIGSCINSVINVISGIVNLSHPDLHL